MKLIPSIAAVLIAAASFSTFAAPLSSVKQVNSEQAANLQSLGVVSVSGISGSPHDAIHALKEKAAADGAGHYRIIGLDTPGIPATGAAMRKFIAKRWLLLSGYGNVANKINGRNNYLIGRTWAAYFQVIITAVFHFSAAAEVAFYYNCVRRFRNHVNEYLKFGSH